MSDLGNKKYTLEKQVESGKKKPEEVMDKWNYRDWETITQETADEAITIMEQKAIGSKLENELIKGKTSLTLQRM